MLSKIDDPIDADELSSLRACPGPQGIELVFLVHTAQHKLHQVAFDL